MKMRKNVVELQYYLYTLCIQMRFTRIIGILYLTQNTKINLIEFATLQSIFALSQFVMEIPSGIISDYFKRKVVLTSGLLLSGVAQIIICSSFVLNSASPFWIVAFAFILEGFARALLSGSDQALFYEKLQESKSTGIYEKVVGRNQFISAISLGLATFLGGVMYAHAIQLPYIMQVVFTLAAIGIIVSIKEIKSVPQKKPTKQEFSQYKKMFRELGEVRSNHQVLFMLFFTCLLYAIINTIFGIMPDYLNTLGFTSAQNGMVIMLLDFIGGLIAMQSYRLSRLTLGHLVTVTCVMMIGGLLFTLIGESKLLLFIGLGLFYIIIDLLYPISLKLYNDYVSDNIRATFLSMTSFITTAVMMLLYPLFGYVVEKNGMNKLLLVTVIVTVPLLTVAFSVYKAFNYARVNNKR